MRYLIPGAVVLAAVAFFFVQEPALAPSTGPVVETPAQLEGRSETPAAPVTDLVPAAPVGAESVRTAVAVSEPVPEVDPCAEIQEAFNNSEAARVAAERERDELRGQVAKLTLDLQRLTYPEDTPYGAFLVTLEAEEITDPYVFARIENWLELFPVFLRPGEATWIAERTTLKDWKQYARTSERAIIGFLGPARLQAELPVARLDELRGEYPEDGFFR